MIKSRLILSIVTSISLLTGCSFGSTGDYVLPAQNDCYLYSAADMEKPSLDIEPVDCSSNHSAETYRIAILKDNQNPSNLSENEFHSIAEELCNPPSDLTLNYWAYFVPTKSDWAKGARWLRCDALNKLGENNFGTWKGQILNSSSVTNTNKSISDVEAISYWNSALSVNFNQKDLWAKTLLPPLSSDINIYSAPYYQLLVYPDNDSAAADVDYMNENLSSDRYWFKCDNIYIVIPNSDAEFVRSLNDKFCQ